MTKFASLHVVATWPFVRTTYFTSEKNAEQNAGKRVTHKRNQSKNGQENE